MPEGAAVPPEGLVRRYLWETKGPGYTLFLALPFAVFYEVGLAVFHQADAELNIRNGADAILRMLFFPHWLEGEGRLAAILWGGFGLTLLFGAIVLWGRREEAGWRVKPGYLAAVFGEAFGWAVLLFIGWLLLLAFGLTHLVGAQQNSAESAQPLSFGLKMVLSCGAGVYEELLFRLMLVGGLLLFLRGLIGMSRPGATLTAVVLAAVLFAAVHYVGPYESFDGSTVAWLKFFFRFGAGLFFSGLLATRSFGVAVASHAFYDIIVTSVERMISG